MLPTVVFLLPGGSERARHVSMCSTTLSLGAHGRVVELGDGDLKAGWLPPEDAELVHFVRPGVVVLPHAYIVASCNLVHVGADYVLMGVLEIGEERAVVLDDVSVSGLVARSWAVREFGMTNQGIDVFVGGVVSEYRGVSVPHILCVEDLA